MIQLIPARLASFLGASSLNGDRARWQTVAALEQACQTLALQRRRRQCGWAGNVPITSTTTLRHYHFREPYTENILYRLGYVTSSPAVRASLSVSTPEDAQAIDLLGTSSTGLDAYAIANVTVLGGTSTPSDNSVEELTAQITGITSDDPEETTPTIYLLFARFQTLRLSVADII